MDESLWTIEELAERVADALAVAHPAQPSGRVREVPDRRTIRWYTTIGLVDRPAAMRGRTALYGRRHLLQLVAVKRLQADGRSLASVQEELLGAPDHVLEQIANLPANLPADLPADPPAPAVARTRFWSAPPAAAGATAPAKLPAAPASRGTRRPMLVQAQSAPEQPQNVQRGTAQPALVPVPAIRLGAGATLLLDTADRTPTADDLAAIAAAAAPLLDLLRQLDLTRGSA